jgi:hypothetical protein
LPHNTFDLINCRLVLRHLSERVAVLRRLVETLRPGGWLQVDEFDNSYEHGLLMPGGKAHDRYADFLAAKAKVMACAGVDAEWGRRAPEAMAVAGLVDIDVEVRILPLRANSPGTLLLAHVTHHLRDRFVAAGFADDRLAEIRDILADPAFLAVSMPIYSVRGRRAS